MPEIAPYIWINGFPGVGKLTTALALQRTLDDAVLLDNHSLIDVVALPRDHPQYHVERKQARQAAFAKYVYSEDGSHDAKKLQRPIIATDCVSDCDIGRSMAAEHKAAAERAGRPFVPVYLKCAKEEQLARVADPSRARSGRKKLIDVQMVSGFLDTLILFQWGGEGVEIDTTELSAAETAQRIWEALPLGAIA